MTAGILTTGFVELSETPVNDNHAVPLGYLNNALGGASGGTSVGTGTLFPSVAPGVENKAVYVNEGGVLSPVTTTEGGGAERMLGVFRGGKLYLDNSFIQGMTTLAVGKAYWVQPDGTLGLTPVAIEGNWSVRAGMAISPTVLAVSILVVGLT